eukprot:CCRYP_013747-RA/>CCRYP_013747-RA protein AED:0.44 eAED:0.44 QI:0/0/0/1/0/0/2/0/122
MHKAGCKVLSSRNECIIIHKGIVIMKGQKRKQNGLWYIPIQQKVHKTPFIIYDDTTNHGNHASNSVYHMTTLAETIQYIHQCLFLPTYANSYLNQLQLLKATSGEYVKTQDQQQKCDKQKHK